MNKRQRHHYYTTHRSWAKTFFFISSYFMLRHTHKNRNKNTITILAWIIKISFHNTSSLRRFALEKVTKKKKTRTNEAVNKKIQSAIGKVTSTSTSNASTYTEKLYRSLCLCQSMRIENTPRKVEWVTLYMKWGSKQKNKKSKKKKTSKSASLSTSGLPSFLFRLCIFYEFFLRFVSCWSMLCCCCLSAAQIRKIVKCWHIWVLFHLLLLLYIQFSIVFRVCKHFFVFFHFHRSQLQIRAGKCALVLLKIL